jgi:hypothetical protein
MDGPSMPESPPLPEYALSAQRLNSGSLSWNSGVSSRCPSGPHLVTMPARSIVEGDPRHAIYD